jgi:hypothetical protein
MGNPLVLQVIGGMLVLAFIFLLVMCWKTWRITHILFAFCAFGAAVTLLAFSAFVLRTHAAWRSHYVSYTAELEKVQAENVRLKEGEGVGASRKEDYIDSVREELNNVRVDRGRVWRDCTLVTPVDADTFRIRTVPANLPPTATPTPNGIVPKTMMYVFTERASEDVWTDPVNVPAYYVGEYVVDDASDTEVTVSATLPLDPDQAQRIGQQGATLALYEMVPLDGHEIFARRDDTEKIMVGMDKEDLAPYMPNVFNWPADKYDRFLDQYYRFNREATEDDSPENTWMMVEFVKPHSIQVDADAEQSLLEGEGRYFDSSGRAIDARLRRGEDGTVRFEVGDVGIFDLQTADTLITDGVCKKVKNVFRRGLHDYGRFFRQAYFRHKDLDASIAQVKRDTDELITLKAKTDDQIAFRQTEKLNLEKDLVGFNTELADVKRYHQALEAEFQNARNRLVQLYLANNQLAEELAEIQYRLAEEINRRTAEATAQLAPPANAP